MEEIGERPPLEILHEYGWEAVLYHLTDSEDRWNFGKAHPFFMELICRNLQRLDFIFDLTSRHEVLPNVAMPRLNYLCMELETVQELQSIEALRQETFPHPQQGNNMEIAVWIPPPAPLEEVHITITAESRITSGEFFSAIETFGNTLKILQIWTESRLFGRLLHLPNQVVLPRLEDLSLIGLFNGRSGRTFPFLDNLIRLNKFEMFIHPPGANMVNDQFEHEDVPQPFFTFTQVPNREILYRSGLWERLSNLHTVNITAYPNGQDPEFGFYNRQIYQNIIAN